MIITFFSLFLRSDRQPEEFTTFLEEKDDRIAQLLEEGNLYYKILSAVLI